MNVYVSFSRTQLAQLHFLLSQLRESGQGTAADLVSEAARALSVVIDEQERLENMIREGKR